ncbi:DUF1641 domain-containing protein [Halobacillus sp. B29]|uniref:DUF1641 domain-containing protein n=1 Tax=Halobacillus sp. B29 TaxID=3457432 RepID=UPI003FCCADA3
MAKPITSIKKYEASREEQIEKDFEEVKAAIADNKTAILKGIDLLKALEESETLDAATAFTYKRKEILANIVEEINRDMYTGILENIPEIVYLLGDLDLKTVRDVTSKLNQGMEEMNAAASSNEKTSVLDLAKALKDPEINRSITMLMNFLKGMGRN